MSSFGWASHSASPATDPALLLRWTLAVIVVLWMPGWLLLRGQLRAWPSVAATYTRLATGLMWLVILGLVLRWTGRVIDPLVYVGLSPLLAWAVNRRIPRDLAGSGAETAESSRLWWWAILACTGLLAVQIWGMAGFAAPPHVDDASNHAFMVARATETGSLDPSVIFSALRPDRLYLLGWHLPAAIVGRLAGVAPYVATWFMAMTFVALTPLALVTLWWRWRVGAMVAVVAAFWVMTNSEIPAASPYSWGGFGVHAGYFIAPLGTILLAAALRSRRPVLALATGAYLAATVHVHFSEVLVIALLAVLTLVMRRGEPERRPAPGWWLPVGLFVLGFALAWVPAMLDIVFRYTGDYSPTQSNIETTSFLRALRGFPQPLGRPDPRFVWAIGGTLVLLALPRWRPVAVASLLVGLLVLTLNVWNDPVSRILAAPFYGHATRVWYQQLYLMPLVAGAATVLLVRAAARRGRVLAALVLLLATVPMGLGYLNEERKIRYTSVSIPFDRNEYLLACEITDLVPEDEVVANYRADGSSWAGHVSGRKFLNALSWAPLVTADGVDVMAAALDLRESPWPAATRDLERRGVQWLYVSDHRLRTHGVLPELAPEDFEGDPRFTAVLERGGTQLLRINWDAEEAGSSSTGRVH